MKTTPQYSPFVTTALLRECVAGSRLREVPKGRWVFLPLEATAIRQRSKDTLLLLSVALGIDREELLEAVLEELQASSKAVALRCLDGVFVHPVSFGKVVLRIARKLEGKRG